MTRGRKTRTFALVLLVGAGLAVLGACRPLPIQAVDLAGSTWALASVDGEQLDVQNPPTVTFHDLDNATVNSSCETVAAGLILESDSDGFGFLEPITRSPKPCEDGDEAEDRLRVDAILDTKTWRVLDKQTIELIGSHVLLMERIE